MFLAGKLHGKFLPLRHRRGIEARSAGVADGDRSMLGAGTLATRPPSQRSTVAILPIAMRHSVNWTRRIPDRVSSSFFGLPRPALAAVLGTPLAARQQSWSIVI